MISYADSSKLSRPGCVLAMVLLLAAGCGSASDRNEGPLDSDTTTAGGNGTGGTTGSADGGENPTSSTGGSSGGSSDGFDVVDPCDDVVCGPDGSCRVTPDGPTCDCPEGYVDVGLRCVTCETVPGGEVSVEIAPVTARVFVEIQDVLGDPLGTTPYDRGEILLRNRKTGDEVLLGTAADEVVEGRALPGTYDVVYRVLESTGRAPLNRSAILGRMTLPDEETIGPVRAAQVRVVVDVDGAPPPNGASDVGRILLRNRKAPEDDVIVVGPTSSAQTTLTVLPGSYEVLYEAIETTVGGALPRNPRAVLSETLHLAGGDGAEVPIALDVSLETVNTGLEVIVDGSPPPAAEYGRLVLVDPVDGTEIPLGNTNEAGGQITTGPVLRRNYDVYYEVVEAPTGLVPANRRALVTTLDWEAVPPANEVPIPVDLSTAQVTIEPKLGGVAPDPSDGVAEVWLRDPQTGDEAYVGRTDEAELSATVLAGSYEIVYRVVDAGTAFAANTAGRLDAVDLVAGDKLSVSVDLDAAAVDGQLSLAMQPPPATPYESGIVWLVDPDREDRVAAASTVKGTYAVRLLPGNYEVRYGVEQGGVMVPVNVDAVIGTVDVPSAGPMSVDIDLEPRLLTFKGTFDGQLAPGAPMSALLRLRSVEGGERFVVGRTDAPAERAVLPGTYVVEYAVEEAGAELPKNTNAEVMCIQVE